MVNSTFSFSFPAIGHRKVTGAFDGGDLSSDSGFLLLAAADNRAGVTQVLCDAVQDQRDPKKIIHKIKDIISERVYAIAQGYEDANDLDRLRIDPALKLACGRLPIKGDDLASQPTISRLENSVGFRELRAMMIGLADCVIAQLPANTHKVILDVDPTEDPCHGQQQFEIFNKFYDSHCYLPLLCYITGEDNQQRILGALLRKGTAKNAAGLQTMLKWVVRLLRKRFPDITIKLRADSGFGHAIVLQWCHILGIDYDLAVPMNSKLQEESTAIQMDAALLATYPIAGEDSEEFGEFYYQAKTWEKRERIVVKAEVVKGKINARYVVTNDITSSAEEVYRFYCLRGDRENRIKEFKIDLSSGRTSCHSFLANQYRLVLHMAAYVIMNVVQTALAGTEWAAKQVETLRSRLFKIAVRIVESVRRVSLHFPTSCPSQGIWRQLYSRLC